MKGRTGLGLAGLNHSSDGAGRWFRGCPWLSGTRPWVIQGRVILGWGVRVGAGGGVENRLQEI